MQTLELSIFRFCAKESYEYYFQKYPIAYDHNPTLFSTLESIENLGFDRSMGLRVQGLCVFDDVPLYELVREFGANLYLEPLSQKYVSKDLVLDKKAMFARYEWFFSKYDFIAPSDRYELYKYLWANTISLQSDDSYLGDGFFLYIQWLLERYPKHFDTLIHTLANAQSGVMSYTPIEDLIYINKPNAPHITHTIHALINKVVRFGQCLGCGRAWINELESIKVDSIPSSALQALSTSQANTQNKSGAGEANKENSQDSRVFIVFDAYASLSAKPLISSTKALLQALGHPLIEPRSKLLPLGGYFGSIVDTRAFIKRAAYNIALAAKERAVLVFGDYESYCSMVFAQTELLRDKTLLNEVCALYGQIDYYINPVQHINTIIAGSQSKLWERESPLAHLKLVAYPSLLACDALDGCQQVASIVLKRLLGPNPTQEEIINATQNLHAHHHPIVSKLGGEWLDIVESRQDFSHLQAYNYEGYLKESSRIRFAGIDAGADMLVVSNVGLFRAFTTLAKAGAKSIGRDPSNTPTLYLPQVALLALGMHNKLDKKYRTLELA